MAAAGAVADAPTPPYSARIEIVYGITGISIMLLRLTALASLTALAGCLGPAEFRGWREPEFKYAACHGSPNAAPCHEQARTACPEGYQLAEERSDPPIQRFAFIFRCGAPPAVVDEPPPRPRTRRAAPPTVPK